MTTKQTRKRDHAILVRLPIALHRQLVKKADAEQRSVNAHVNYLVEQDLKPGATDA